MNIYLRFLLFSFILISCKHRDRGEYNSGKNNIENIPTGDLASNIDRSLNEIDRKSIEGVAVRIIDGDTFVLLLNNEFETGVRLNGIDCPERKQAFSQRANEELSNLIFDREVIVYYDKKDGFGRVLGDIYVDGANVNHEMVRRGMAWHYVKYSDDETLAKLEKEARRNRTGLWSDPNPIPPWDYRGK